MTWPNTNDEDLDLLYERVTSAILLAETAEAAKNKAVTAAAYLEVSFLEEEIARLLPVDNPEGAIARCGVVTAAISASQFLRAIEMAENYAAEPGIASQLLKQLSDLRDEASVHVEPRESNSITVDPAAKFRLLAA